MYSGRQDRLAWLASSWQLSCVLLHSNAPLALIIVTPQEEEVTHTLTHTFTPRLCVRVLGRGGGCLQFGWRLLAVGLWMFPLTDQSWLKTIRVMVVPRPSNPAT